MKLLGRNSVTWHLTLLFAAVSMAVLLLLGLLIASLVENHFVELDKELLDGKLELVRHSVQSAQSAEQLAALPAQLDTALVGHHGLGVAIWQADGTLLYSRDTVSFPEALHRAHAAPFSWHSPDGRHFRGLSGTAESGNPAAQTLIVALATDLVHHEHFMASFKTALWQAVGLAAVVCGLLGWAVARRGLAPLRAISRNASGITAKHLDYRLPTGTIPAELAEVTHTLNAMLARLEDSFQRLSDFSSDIAHELRTPVSNLLTQTQVTLARSRTPEAYREALASNVEEFERLSKMIADMLFLAKADHALTVAHREAVALHHEAQAVLDFYQAVAEEAEVHFDIEGNAHVAGDRLMLRRAISNLLSNAVRHTPRGGSVRVQISSDGTWAILTVENTGKTIPAEHLPRLFDRFYRADASRQRQTEGGGLGLAITRSILQAHQGSVTAHSANGLTRFELRLPLDQSP